MRCVSACGKGKSAIDVATQQPWNRWGLDEDAEYRLALETAEKKIQKADRSDPKLKSRLSSFLARRGFGWEVIARVVGEVLIEED